MNSPPEALSPSPSTPSSASSFPDEVSLPPTSTATPGGSSTMHPLQTLVSASPSQAKRRLPSSSSSVFAGREGRENKSRRRDRDRDSDRDMREYRDREDRSRKGGGLWEPLRGEMQGHGGPPARLREELVDVPMVEYVRSMYGDPFDDTILKERSKTS